MAIRRPIAAADQRLIEIIGAMLAELHGGPPRPVALGDRLEGDLGIDSLARVELALRVERAFGVELPEDRATEAQTVRDLLDAVAAAAPRRARQAAVETPAAPRAPPVGEPRDASTLMAALDWHTERHGERAHVLLVEDGEQAETLTYGALASGARAVMQGLRARGLEPGQAVAIMLPSSLAFFHAFAGVLLAGGVPVPIYPPFRWSQIEDHLRRQARILENCRAPLLVTVAQARPLARLLNAEVATLQHVVTVDELAAARQAAVGIAHGPQDVALIQYTSGSTGQPKGVILTHANLLANIRAMGEAVQASSRDVFVSWLPLYHDMGLIGAWLGSLYYGIPLVLMPPQKFLARPSRWLWAIHRHRGTLSAGPNFAYEIAAAKIPEEELQGLDLSCWRIAFNGAEPVRAATLEKFAQRFARYGFDAHALMPVYGLAESAVGLTFPPSGRAPLVERIDRQALARDGRARPAQNDRSMKVVSCGRPLPGHEVRVLDERGGEAPERVEGRIEFRGPSAASGYFDNAEQTAKLFHDGWLDTGDVGYIAGGELFITSRVKDLIIRGGHNIHPYDLEEAVGALPGIRKGSVAVFGATDRAAGSERIVVVAETRERDVSVHASLKTRIRELAIAHLGVPADDIVLAASRVVLKTSSGKIRRAAVRDLYERGVLGATGRPVVLQLARLALGAALGWLRGLRRRQAGWLFAAYAWSLFGVLSLLGGALLLAVPRRAAPRWARMVARALVALCGVPLRVEGKERLAGALPAVVVANHASYADSIVLTALLPADVKFVAKRELAAYPAGPFLRRLGVRFVERFRTQRAIDDARELAAGVRGGESPMLFPEGRFWRAPGLRQFHLGAFAAAAQSGRPVLPVALRGTRSVLRSGSWLPRRHPVEVFIGAPLWPKGEDWPEALRLRDEARRAILERCGEPDLSAAPDEPRIRARTGASSAPRASAR